jgi:hypothetical protein
VSTCVWLLLQLTSVQYFKLLLLYISRVNQFRVHNSMHDCKHLIARFDYKYKMGNFVVTDIPLITLVESSRFLDNALSR